MSAAGRSYRIYVLMVFACLVSSLLNATIMIRKNSLFCKLIRIKTSSKFIFDSYMAVFQPELETCPVCGSCGNCYVHAYYDRSVIDFRNGRKVTDSLCVLRLIAVRLLEQMNSKLEVDSVYGKGSSFSFVLPQKVVDTMPIFLLLMIHERT